MRNAQISTTAGSCALTCARLKKRICRRAWLLPQPSPMAVLHGLPLPYTSTALPAQHLQAANSAG